MMAVEPIFTPLISNLSSLALEEANRITYLEDNIESLEKELLLMNPLMESIQSMVEDDEIAAQWLHESHLIFLRAEDVASKYRRGLAKKNRLKIFKLPSLVVQSHELALDLERVTLDIHVCSQKGIKILKDRNLNLPFSSDQQTTTAEGNSIVSNSSTFNKLNEFLTQNRNHLPDALLECLVSVRDKMAPFDKLLQQVVVEEEGLDERQKLWLQEIKDVFRLLEQSLLTFQCSKEKEKDDIICEESFTILMRMLRSLKKYEEDLKEKIIEIQNRIDRITSRYDLYAIGEFKAKNGLRTIVPRQATRRRPKHEESVKLISMPLPIPIFGRPLLETLEKIVKGLFTAFLVSFDNNPSISSLLEMDLKLVNALLEDASKMGDSDKRLKVWLEQVTEIYHEMKNLDSNVTETIQRKWGLGKMVGLCKISQDSKEIEKKIEDALVRKARYDIGSFVARNGNVVAEQQVHSMTQVGGSSAQSAMPNGKRKLEEQVQLMKELQLIDALLEDVSTMDKLDVRLKVWLQEILGVAQEAREIVQRDFHGIFRSLNVSKKMNKIRKRIDDISEWKRNYFIHGIRATNGQSRMSDNLEAAEAYPSADVAAEFESLRREVKLMKGLETDIQEMVGLDGKLEAWMKEMHHVIADVDKFIHERGDITGNGGTGMGCCILIQEITTLRRDMRDMRSILHFKEKIQELHERRIRYGIEGINLTSSTDVAEEQHPQANLISRPAESEITISTMPESSTTTTIMNHENVSPYLWRCLFHFLLFPVGKEIPARRLIAVWIAEGIVSPKKGENKPAEYFCQLRLSELVKRGMIEATRWKINGKDKAYKLCDNMRETLSERAKAANFFQDAAENMTFRFAHHPADVNNPIDGSKPYSSSELKSHYKKVISFFSFDTTEGRKHGENIGNFLHRCIDNSCFRLMRVLDLERVFKPKLPRAIGALTGLKYLGLRWTYLESLPDTVSKLLNLLVLDVKRTYISTLPKSIWSMQYLRHLYLSETYRTRFVSRPRRNDSTNNNKSLNDLLTLWGAFIDEDSPVVNGLDTIHNVRKLGLTCRSMSSSPISTEKMKSRLEEVGDWITKLENLEDLRIKSFDDLDSPSDLHLKPFSGHGNLSTVYLVGRLRYPTIVSGAGFPVSITDITLSNSELEFDPMAALQSFPNLVILRLLAKSTKCSKMECCSTQQVRFPFPKLQVLKIWSLEHFDEWKLGEGSLPNLRDLEIRNCHKLKMIPYEIKNLEALSKFSLSHKFEEEIKKNQFTLWNEIEHLFEFSEE